MFPIKNIFFVLIGVNCLFLLVFITDLRPPVGLTPTTEAFVTNLPTQKHTQGGSDDDSDVDNRDDDVSDVDNSDDDASDVDNSDDDKSDVSDSDKPKKKAPSEAAKQLLEAVRDKVKKVSKGSAKSSNKHKENSRSRHHKGTEKEKEKKKESYKARLNKEKENSKKVSKQLKDVKKEVKTLESQLRKADKRVTTLSERRDHVQTALRWSNPFFLLGAYPRVGDEYFNSYPDGKPFYDTFNYGLINDPDYCEIVDFYNIAHPENMFESMNFFTDYARNGLARSNVIRQIGVDSMREISRYMKKKDFNSSRYHLNPLVTNFFTKRVDIHIYHMLGKHFNCATQMYNHIPGHGVLKRKDLIVDSVDNYAKRFSTPKLSKCFNKKKFFPYSYRLYIEEECQAFFEKINSKEYIKSLKTEPIQFVIKLGYGAHRAKGVWIFDKNETELWREFYEDGARCGYENKSIIAQTYITNPLLLDYNNKFDFRVYMLVASTNPLIVYYHDGFLRVSLDVYDKFSSEKSVHLTNTHLSKEIFAEAEATNTTILGMNADELRDYQMWTFERLGTYLHKAGKVSKDWVEKTLKPSFYEAFIHTVRMSAHAFWNQSNVYEMFGLDFMLDEELNLWFIECNSSPQLIGTNDLKTKFLTQMLKDLFEIQYGLYRSRMSRVLKVLQKINRQAADAGKVDYTQWRKEYADASRNKFEEEYKIKKENSFKLIMDMNLKGADAFFGHLEPECAAH